MRRCRGFTPFRPTVHDLPPIKGQRCPSEPTSDHAIAVDETRNADGRRPLHNHVTTPDPTKSLPSQGGNFCSQSSEEGIKVVVFRAKQIAQASIASNPRLYVQRAKRRGNWLRVALSQERCLWRTIGVLQYSCISRNACSIAKFTRKREGNGSIFQSDTTIDGRH